MPIPGICCEPRAFAGLHDLAMAATAARCVRCAASAFGGLLENVGASAGLVAPRRDYSLERLEDEYAFLLRRCGDAKALADGKRLQARIAESGHDRSTFIGNMVVQMYGKCGSLEDAWRVFCNISHRNVFSWNIIIAAYAQNGHPTKSIQLFRRMLSEQQLVPTKVTFINVLTACSSLRDLAEGREIHKQIVASGLGSDLLVATALLNMYGKCKSLEDARSIFDGMHHRRRDVVAWTAMISAYAQNGHGEEALKLFGKMDPDGVKPNRFTFSSVIDACSETGRLQEGKAIHARIAACGLESEVVVGNSLINMYGKCESLDEARRVFKRMHRRDLVSWNAMIAANAQNGHSREALRLYREMGTERGLRFDNVTLVNVLGACSNLGELAAGRSIHNDAATGGFESDLVVGTALVNMYGRCQSLEEARRAFEKIEAKDVVCWNAMIAAYAQNGHGEEALAVFRQMAESCAKPNEATFASVLDACSVMESLEEGKAVHAQIIDSGLLDYSIVVGTAIVSMYSRCGSLARARQAFDKMRVKNEVSWMNMIAAYAQHGCSQDALDLFQQMHLEGAKPNEIAFISVLYSCSHAGMLEEGHSHFVSMLEDHGIAPSVEHYGCMIDLLGRGGHLQLAEDLISSMPFQPDARAWMSFLGACRIHSDEGRGARAAERMLELEPESSAAYVALSSIYAARKHLKAEELERHTSQVKPSQVNVY